MTWALRAAAFAIAIAGVVDPSFTWRHRDKPVVSLIAVDERDAPLRDRAAAALANDFTVVTRPDAGAAAVVAVGTRPPDSLEIGRRPAFALHPDEPLAITQIDLPERARAHARVPVSFRGTSRGPGPVEAQLRMDGLIVDRLTVKPALNGDVVGALTFAPTAAGVARIQLVLSSGATRTSADEAVEIEAVRWRIVSYDPRPSWASTFVRRSLEQDPRFLVTAHVATSTRSSVEAGAPAALMNLPDDVQVVILGAPDALRAPEVDRLEAFARAGGSVCLLLDRVQGGPFERLTAAHGWRTQESSRPIPVDAGDRVGRLFAMELAAPQLDARASIIASAGTVPAVWRVPVGRGSVIVSGALDAWRHRASAGSRFDAFWRTVVADAAESARRGADVRLGRRLFGPGERLDVHASTGGDVTIDGPAGRQPELPLRADAGDFAASPFAPSASGLYSLVVNAEETSVPFLVVAGAGRPSEPALLTAWATAHGGASYGPEKIASFAAALRQAIVPPVDATRVFPMRSIWWLAPFAFAASAEWWLRRRRGQC